MTESGLRETDPGQGDALFVLTAALLTPAQFPGALGDDFPEACARLGLSPVALGYGLVFGQDGDGARWTVVVDDVSLVALAVASWDCGMEYDLSPAPASVVVSLPGWPLALSIAAPGLPAPHDPAPESASDMPTGALTPPSEDRWGPAQRRLGADEIARCWSAWREQIDDTHFAARSTDSGHGTGAPAAGLSRVAVRRVMAEAHAYLRTPPPPGRVRSSFASDAARMLRVDGPGWSLVARTDDIAFVLLDEEPGEVVPVGRGPELPGLLAGLDRIAVRPA